MPCYLRSYLRKNLPLGNQYTFVGGLIKSANRHQDTLSVRTFLPPPSQPTLRPHLLLHQVRFMTLTQFLTRVEKTPPPGVSVGFQVQAEPRPLPIRYRVKTARLVLVTSRPRCLACLQVLHIQSGRSLLTRQVRGMGVRLRLRHLLKRPQQLQQILKQGPQPTLIILMLQTLAQQTQMQIGVVMQMPLMAVLLHLQLR